MRVRHHHLLLSSGGWEGGAVRVRAVAAARVAGQRRQAGGVVDAPADVMVGVERLMQAWAERGRGRIVVGTQGHTDDGMQGGCLIGYLTDAAWNAHTSQTHAMPALSHPPTHTPLRGTKKKERGVRGMHVLLSPRALRSAFSMNEYHTYWKSQKRPQKRLTTAKGLACLQGFVCSQGVGQRMARLVQQHLQGAWGHGRSVSLAGQSGAHAWQPITKRLQKQAQVTAMWLRHVCAHHTERGGPRTGLGPTQAPHPRMHMMCT